MARGETQYNPVSRFIKEIPRYLLKMEQVGSQNTFRNSGSFGGSPLRTMSGASMPVPRRSVSYSNSAGDFDFEKPKPRPTAVPYASTPAAPAKDFGTGPSGSLNYAVGDKVRHMKFGEGTVTNIVNGGRDFEVTVLFDTYGVKKMLASFANLKKC